MLNISHNRLDNVRGLSSLQALIAVNLGAWVGFLSLGSFAVIRDASWMAWRGRLDSTCVTAVVVPVSDAVLVAIYHPVFNCSLTPP